MEKKKPQFNELIDSVQVEVRRWNALYPLDRWYRKKFNIPFNSEQHQNLDVLDIRFAFEEHVLYREVDAYNDLPKDEFYTPRTGNWLRKQEEQASTDQEIRDIYDAVDLSKIDGDPDIITVNTN